MKVTLLPSSVSPGDGARGHYLTSYLVDDAVAIDAGGLGLLGDVDAQARVTDIFLSHAHIDHIAALPIFLENVYNARRDCVTIHAGEATLDCLRRDVFNDRIWPDFVRLSAQGPPFLRLAPLRPGEAVEAAGLRIIPEEVDHQVPTLGFLVRGAGASVLFPSDTGPTAAIWRLGDSAEDLKAVFLEAAFPDEMADLARVAKHLTPALFAGEARKLSRPARFIAVHIKPRYFEEVAQELGALGLPNVEIGRPGASYHF